jgi:hypothetical protein
MTDKPTNVMDRLGKFARGLGLCSTPATSPLVVLRTVSQDTS